MIPILYDVLEYDFETNGIGRLSDAISCVVTEERNGAYDLVMEYPEGGMHSEDIELRKIIYAKPAKYSNEQPFRIYKITKPLNGKYKVYAHHVSYDLNHMVVSPCGPYTTAYDALNGMLENCIGDDFGYFTIGTCGPATGTFQVTEPASFRSWVGGREGSILDTFPGELTWDKYTISYGSRGRNRGLKLRYGKNISDITQTNEAGDYYYSGTSPWMKMGDGTVLQAARKVYTRSTMQLPGAYKIVDCTQWIDEEAIREANPDATEAQIITLLQNALRAKAYEINAEMDSRQIPTIEVSFVDLSSTEEYKGFTALFEQAALCDTVTVEYERLGITATADIIKTEYNVLLDRFDKLTIGAPKSSFGSTLASLKDSTNSTINNRAAQISAKAFIEAVQKAMAALTEAKGYTDTEAAAAEAAAIAAANAYALAQAEAKKAEAISTAASNAESAIAANTALITGSNGGYVHLIYNANGKPIEIVICDNMNLANAVNVWRWNVNGLGFSSTGYNGTYTTALSAAGVFNTDFIAANSLSGTKIISGTLDAGKITTGYLDASLIKTSALTDRDGVNSINMETGAFSLANGNFIHSPGNAYISLYNNLSLRLNGIPLAGKEFQFIFSTDSYYEGREDVVIVPTMSKMRVTIGGMRLLFGSFNGCELGLCRMRFIMYPYMLHIHADLSVTNTVSYSTHGFAIYGGPKLATQNYTWQKDVFYNPMYKKTSNGVTDGIEVSFAKYFSFSRECTSIPSGYFDVTSGVAEHRFVFAGNESGSFTFSALLPTKPEIVETTES